MERTPRGCAITALLAILAAGASSSGLCAGEERAADPAAPVDRDDAAAPVDPEDAARLEALRLRLLEWKGSGETTAKEGLDIHAAIIPDALAYKTAATYLALREKGNGHAEAIGVVAERLERWKRYEESALFLVTVRNERFRLGGDTRRIYALQANLERRGMTLHAEAGGKRTARFRFRLGGKPAGLRIAKLRIQKFWKTADGVTGRPRSKEKALRDPASVGREPLLSKPFAAAVIESEPAELELLVSQRSLERAPSDRFRVGFHHWKRYEGPFEKDILDLNEGRSFRELEDFDLLVSLPPQATEVSPEVGAILDEARRAAEAR